MNEIIRIENLTHTYGEGTPFRRSAVENLSLDIYRGEFLGLIGHTGSGKSTLIQHLNGLLKPTGGRVLLDGEDIWADPKKIRSVRFRVGLVFQYPEYQLFEETVYRDIAFGPTNMGLTGAELAQRLLTTGTADPASARDELLHTMACKAAIKGGWKTSPQELERLVRAVMDGDVKYCPHGRPVAIQLTKKELEKQFKRA